MQTKCLCLELACQVIQTKQKPLQNVSLTRALPFQLYLISNWHDLFGEIKHVKSLILKFLEVL